MILQGLWWVQGFGSEIKHSRNAGQNLKRLVRFIRLLVVWQWVPALPLNHGQQAFTFSGVPLNADIY
ncbi:hypothetical protein BV61_00730 [Candidatus Synechococcus spongiarum LMB bulk15M]|uniref:Uncharacterized protein n=1 Tax=Candidatus Synechococcus spongiarum LMB bulk15M TaxID=1943582 RepID=A0A1T1D3J5_9SYNE|nr:hypothetical protein BV61_00730 [Candidatus Synechococcus spongiarum LMB bulk15M]